MTEKRYNDEEVALILRRALEADEGRPEGGLTLVQLKEIAAEVGIPAHEVETAALAVQAERGVAAPSSGFGRTALRYEVEIPGELGPERRGDVLRAIRSAMGRQGIASEEFGGLSWTARDAFGGRYVTVRSENGRTRVEALGNFRDGAAVTAGAAGTVGLMVSGLVLKTLGGLGAVGLLGPAGLVIGATIPAYALYRRWFAKEDAALREAVANVAAEVDAAPRGPVSDTPDDEV
jgi:hypothetical protein